MFTIDYGQFDSKDANYDNCAYFSWKCFLIDNGGHVCTVKPSKYENFSYKYLSIDSGQIDHADYEYNVRMDRWDRKTLKIYKLDKLYIFVMKMHFDRFWSNRPYCLRIYF